MGDSTKTQYYLALQIMVGKVFVGSCVKHLEDDLVAPEGLKRVLVRVQDAAHLRIHEQVF